MPFEAPPNPTFGPHVDEEASKALPDDQLIIKYSSPEQVHAALQVGLDAAQKETGKAMELASIRQTHSQPDGPDGPHVYELWATYRPASPREVPQSAGNPLAGGAFTN